jgi:electron transfer flavoprotein alpha subunit
METILFLAHTDADGKLPRPAMEALAAAGELASALKAALVTGVFGGGVSCAAQLAGAGATKSLSVAGADFADARYASDAAAAEALARAASATLVIAPATSRLARVLPGVAQRLGGRIDTHATNLSSKDGVPFIARWFYRQRIEAQLSRTSRPWLVLLDGGCHAPFAPEGTAPAMTEVTVNLAASDRRTHVMGLRSPKSDAQTIRPEARLLFVAGAGWTKKQADGKPHGEEAGKLILAFLTATKASLGSSKSLVDQSGEGQSVLPFLSHLNQVGQTGATPRHPKGLATCCHGEEPHVVGWRFINERRAVNLDPGCGWARGKADVLYVADAFEVVAKVNALLAGKA